MCAQVYTDYPHKHAHAHACMHCRHTNQICLKCGTLKDEKAPVYIKNSCDVLVGCMGVCMCAGVCTRLCVRVKSERQYSQIAPQAASHRALTPRLAVRGKRGWAEKRKKSRGGRQGERREFVCVYERERAAGRERHGRTAASISPIAGAGPRGGTRVGILLNLNHPRKASSPTRRVGYLPLLQLVSSRDCGEGPGHRNLQPLTADTPQWIN